MATKDRIIFESLKLFSTHGFESVSTRMIAKSVGLSDSVIYKHFRNKQEIFDIIVETCLEKFKSKRESVNLETIRWTDVEKICMDMFRFQTTDEWIVPFRKFLLVEQFKNPEIQKIYRKIFVDIPVDGMSRMFSVLIEQGCMKKGNPRVYAMELYAPFFMYHTFEEKTESLLKELEEHVVNFRYNVISDPAILEIDDEHRRTL